MSALPWIKVLLAVAGITVWAFGFRQDNDTLRWVGIALLAIAALLRFYRPRPRGTGDRPAAG